jgi:hypothetical protein
MRPRRARCGRCGRTHVLLAVTALRRRADVAEVIRAALAALVGGGGFRVIAGQLGRPPETVRGWLRRFTSRAEAVRVLFAAVADAVAAVAAAASRWSHLGAVPVRTAASAASNGMLLARGWP